jgi:hypothetical protein
MSSPRDFECWTCGAAPGSQCVRPSEHRVFGGGFHATRTSVAHRLHTRAGARRPTRVEPHEDLEEIVEVGLAWDWTCGCKLWHAYGRTTTGDYEGGIPIREWCSRHDPDPPQLSLFGEPEEVSALQDP